MGFKRAFSNPLQAEMLSDVSVNPVKHACSFLGRGCEEKVMFNTGSYWYDFIVQNEECAQRRKTNNVEE